MSSTERFVALLVGLVAILGGIGGMLRLLMRISYRMGELVTRFGDHVTDATRIHGDQEERIRDLERDRPRLGRGRSPGHG